jgi:Asp-tRNA(Asn)/Glu-tRNA(Gln) amidotransferase A subunit family amidase
LFILTHSLFSDSVSGGNLHNGTPINPASPSLFPGGSCSGSAVAVSAQLVDFALGTDTTGDVRIPACFCGVLCFKSSHGVVSTLGTIANSQSLDTIGIISLISNLHIERF